MYTTIYKVKFKTVGCLVYEMREVSFNGGYVIMETLDSVNIPIRKDETHKGDYGKILLMVVLPIWVAQLCLLRAHAFIVVVD